MNNKINSTGDQLEIERKYIIEETPENLTDFPSTIIKQAYISTSPVIRIRQLGEHYILTVKGKGLISRKEFELEIDQNQFQELSKKTEGAVIDKIRYFIPFETYTIELDLFKGSLEGLVIAEVEFPSLDAANNFAPPTWFGKDVSEDRSYQNSNLSKGNLPTHMQ